MTFLRLNFPLRLHTRSFATDMSELSSLKTPFKYHADIMNVLKSDFSRIRVNDNCLEESQTMEKIDTLCKWMCTTPKYSTYRINTFKTDAQSFINRLKEEIVQYKDQLPLISTTPHLPEVVFVHAWDEFVNLDFKRYEKEVIIDAKCGSAVLRGSHVFSPGVLGMPHGTVVNDKVSVFADVSNQCKKGTVTPWENGNKIFIGNGIVKQTRNYLFRDTNNEFQKSGIAIYMTDVVSRLPRLANNVNLRGLGLLQNLPSILCSRVLNPQPGEVILDMCAAPGNKTTHISALMKGEGTVVAIEKYKSHIKRLVETCEELSGGNVTIFHDDSTKIAAKCKEYGFDNTPPFPANFFDRILLDTPCSGLGQRPQLSNGIRKIELCSYTPLQKQLFSTAVDLLKPNGILVYSTCTVTIAENEGIVAWALRRFPYLKLKSVKDQFSSDMYGSKGYSIDGLPEEESQKLCRFGPESDTIGFFIACFVKREN